MKDKTMRWLGLVLTILGAVCLTLSVLMLSGLL